MEVSRFGAHEGGETAVAGYLGKRFIQSIINVMDRQKQCGIPYNFPRNVCGKDTRSCLLGSVFTFARSHQTLLS